MHTRGSEILFPKKAEGIRKEEEQEDEEQEEEYGNIVTFVIYSIGCLLARIINNNTNLLLNALLDV